MTPEQIRKVQSLGAKAAMRFGGKCWWADREDLAAAAVAAMVDATQRFDPDRGVEYGAYCWRVAEIAVKKALLKASAPVSAHHRPEVLMGLQRAPLSALEAPGRPAEHNPWADERLTREQFIRRVRQRLIELLGTDGASFALGVLGDEHTTHEVAQHHRLSSWDVRRAADRARARLASDPQLQELWTEASL